MRILILGGDGMLGHQMFTHLLSRHDVRVTLRKSLSAYRQFDLFDSTRSYADIDLSSTNKLVSVISEFNPAVVINAVGFIKQRMDSERSIIPCIEINALLPHRIVEICRSINTKLIHISTDCVFSGKKGNYRESDTPDATDLYGRAKLLGEVAGDNCLTLRTSLIGPELFRKKSLLEWFLSQKGAVCGYKKAIFSGFTTVEFSRIIEKIIIEYPYSSGTYHVASTPLSKFDLLTLINNKMNRGLKIIPDESVCCDRSLDSTEFNREFSYCPPTCDKMIEELCHKLIEEKR